MTITFANYKTCLPESKQDIFCQMAGRETGRLIVFKDKVLRFANIDEQ